MWEEKPNKPISIKMVALVAMPKTGNGIYPFLPMATGIASAAVAAYAVKRREKRC